MNQETTCTMESRLVEALGQGELPAELKAHAAVCEACAEVVMIHSFFESAEEVSVPPPGLVYWKADLRARREQAERAMRPAAVMQWLTLPVLGALVIGSIAVVRDTGVVIAAALFVILLGAAMAVLYYKLGAAARR